MNSNDELCYENRMQSQNGCNVELAEIADGIFFDTRAHIEDKPVISMPIAEMATLGAGVKVLLCAFFLSFQRPGDAQSRLQAFIYLWSTLWGRLFAIVGKKQRSAVWHHKKEDDPHEVQRNWIPSFL